MSNADLTELATLNTRFRDLTGQEAYLYTSEPKPGEVRVVFRDGVKLGYRRGLEWMRTLLTCAQSGDWTAAGAEAYTYDREAP